MLTLWFMTGLFAVVLGVSNIVPYRMHGILNDGFVMKALRSRMPEGDRFVAMARLVGVGQMGTRPRDYPERLLAAAEDHKDGSPQEASAHIFRATALFDSGDCQGALEAAGKAVACLDESAVLYFSNYSNEYAAYLAWCGDPAVAREVFAKVKKSGVSFRFAYHRTEAATLLAEGRVAEARDAVEVASNLLKDDRSIGDDMFVMDREWIEAIRVRIEEATQAGLSAAPKQVSS